MSLSKADKEMRRIRKSFESRDVFSPRELPKKIRPTGYEAYRVSPRTTKKYGKEYRKIYGASIEPDYTRKVTGKKNVYGANVRWHEHGYTSKSAKPGTRMIIPLSDYPVSQAEARIKLMMKEKRLNQKKRKSYATARDIEDMLDEPLEDEMSQEDYKKHLRRKR